MFLWHVNLSKRCCCFGAVSTVKVSPSADAPASAKRFSLCCDKYKVHREMIAKLKVSPKYGI